MHLRRDAHRSRRPALHPSGLDAGAARRMGRARLGVALGAGGPAAAVGRVVARVLPRPPAHRARGDGYVIAPADGRIVDIAVVDEPMYLHAPATRISIFMSVFDVHVNRYPASGTIELVRYNKGAFLHAASDKASLDNEQASVGLRTVPGPLLVRQIAGLIARRIVTDGRPGEPAAQGARMGMIRFGSRVDVFLASAAPH